MFSIRRNKTIKYFWDSANFYKSGYGHMTLNNASKMYLGIEKNDKELNIDRSKIGSESGYYEKHRDKIIEYSIKDCVLTAKLFQRTIDGFEKIGFLFPLKPYSEASIFKEYLKDKWEQEMTVDTIINTALDWQNKKYDELHNEFNKFTKKIIKGE